MDGLCAMGFIVVFAVGYLLWYYLSGENEKDKQRREIYDHIMKYGKHEQKMELLTRQHLAELREMKGMMYYHIMMDRMDAMAPPAVGYHQVSHHSGMTEADYDYYDSLGWEHEDDIYW